MSPYNTPSVSEYFDFFFVTAGVAFSFCEISSFKCYFRKKKIQQSCGNPSQKTQKRARTKDPFGPMQPNCLPRETTTLSPKEVTRTIALACMSIEAESARSVRLSFPCPLESTTTSGRCLARAPRGCYKTSSPAAAPSCRACRTGSGRRPPRWRR
jgi:hypothetical protein